MTHWPTSEDIDYEFADWLQAARRTLRLFQDAVQGKFNPAEHDNAALALRAEARFTRCQANAIGWASR